MNTFSDFGRSFSLTGNKASFSNCGLSQPLRIMAIGDTHLTLDDERGLPFRENSCRMAGYSTNAKENFLKTLEDARNEKYDLILLVGDLVSFPSEAGIEFAVRALNETGIPWFYTAGNHDWHYEGLPGTEVLLREEWTRKRLLPLFQGHDPLMYSVNRNGLEILMLDDSTNEILPEQLAFYREKAASGAPLLLAMHVPLYVPGRSIFFSCGNPNWCAANDPYWQIERRPRWPESGHTETTMAFYREVFSAENPVAVIAGHTHEFTLDCFNGRIQLVTAQNSNGHYLDLRLS